MRHEINITLTVDSNDVTTAREMREIVERVITSQISATVQSIHCDPSLSTEEYANMSQTDRRRLFERYYS